MPDKKYIVAFEIGSSKIRGAVGTVDDNGTLTVVAVEQEPLNDSVRYGSIRKVPDVSDRILSITRKLEDNPAVRPGRIKGSYVPISGITLKSMNTQIVKKFDQEVEITKEIISQLKQEARQKAPADRDVVAVMTGGYTVDTIAQKNPVGVVGREIKADLSPVYCRPQIINNLNRVFSERLPMAINGQIPLPLAEAGLVLTDDEKNLGVMLVDFGAETTTVCIFKKETFRYLATIPMGSRNITRDLTSLNYTERQAEEIKTSRSNVSPDYVPPTGGDPSLDTTKINQIVSERAGEIIANIIAQIKYAGMKDTDLPGGIVLVGDGANLKGFMQLLASHTGLKVRRGTPLGAVKKANLQIKDTDAIDVISILRVAASFNDQKICVEFPEPVKEPEPNPHPSKDDNNEAPEVEDPYKKPKSKPKDGTKKDFGSSVKNLFGKLMEALDDSADDYDDNNN
ncbi:MAG: cell division protein FtsA [Bacteroides sp.]|nr:cell division protein FtsA [Bacteroidales bacterium]MBD5379023.1 cell division protein FtsA [Bacteroides sp.]